MAEGARLESVYTERYRGFESLPHRHLIQNEKASVNTGAFLYLKYQTGRVRTLVGSTRAKREHVALFATPVG